MGGENHVEVKRRGIEKGHWCWYGKGSSFSESMGKNGRVNTDSMHIAIKLKAV